MDSQQQVVGPWPGSGWRWIVAGLCALGLVLSAYLSWLHLMGGPAIGCGGGSSCEQVLHSRWSAIGGLLPVSGLAAGAYLAMLIASFFAGPGSAPADRRLAWGAMVVLAGATLGSAIWFLILQKWAVSAFCPYCLATHLVGLGVAGVVFWQGARQRGNAGGVGQARPAVASPSLHPSRRLIGPRAMVGLVLVGLLLAGTLAAAQVFIAPPPVFESGQSAQSIPAPEPGSSPAVGPPGARYVVTLFYDYECAHCQRVHSMLDGVVRRYDGQVAFVLCPAPLNSHCNPYVARDLDPFKESCELAKLGLAVWVADRSAFAAFNHWMFSFESGDRWHGRTYADARVKAAALVGEAALDRALADPWVDRYLQASIQRYGSTSESGNAVPKLAYGSRWVTPEPDTEDDLCRILRDSLGLPYR